jgi:hypothetical protein
MIKLKVTKDGYVTIEHPNGAAYGVRLKEPQCKLLRCLSFADSSNRDGFAMIPTALLMNAVNIIDKRKFTKLMSSLRMTLGLGKEHLPTETNEGFRLLNVKCELVE